MDAFYKEPVVSYQVPGTGLLIGINTSNTNSTNRAHAKEQKIRGGGGAERSLTDTNVLYPNWPEDPPTLKSPKTPP